MAYVLIVCADLLFASRLEGPLRAAGEEVTRLGELRDGAGRHRAGRAGGHGAVALIDLTADGIDIGDTLARAREALAPGALVVGFYPHVDQELRSRAEQAGYDAVVPRSRIARDPTGLIAALRRGSATEDGG